MCIMRVCCAHVCVCVCACVCAGTHARVYIHVGRCTCACVCAFIMAIGVGKDIYRACTVAEEVGKARWAYITKIFLW